MPQSEDRPREVRRSGRRDLLRAGALSVLGSGRVDVLSARADGIAPAEPGREAARDGSPRAVCLPAHYYQQFDADPGLGVPAEGYGGWKREPIDLAWDRTALVVMHAWDCGTRDQYPGWYWAVEYIPRAEAICRTVFPRLLGAVRREGFRLFHVVGGGDYYRSLPGYRRAVELAGPSPAPPEQIVADETLRRLREFRSGSVYVGPHNEEDVRRGFAALDFAPQARPRGDEGVAEDGHQLFALCKHHGINHLIYAGFAINWCLLMSPGGMLDMSRRGLICSAIRQAVTAVENKETARGELCKEIGLWRVALAFGFVFDLDDFVSAISGEQAP
ncbi:hypothetical protein ElP_70670 (plasmid) [Tautonia plasticadhaerens]|uniref:Isochorismatase family protein n=2 Tax=Tautonia plasticadhaerens TaxID=2527974 RepID=A0A518HE43_9BACT|nr:hypothetical protein ElP_70670 [Tautonia plasticadhaerens]